MRNTILYTTDSHTPNGYREATLDEIMRGARQALSARVRRGTVFTSPKITADYLIARIAGLPHEVFTLIYVDLCGAIIYVPCGFVAAEGAGFRAAWST